MMQCNKTRAKPVKTAEIWQLIKAMAAFPPNNCAVAFCVTTIVLVVVVVGEVDVDRFVDAAVVVVVEVVVGILSHVSQQLYLWVLLHTKPGVTLAYVLLQLLRSPQGQSLDSLFLRASHALVQ